MKVLLLSKDLMFISRVKEVAGAHGGEVIVAKSEERFREAIADSQAESSGVLLIDLEKSPLGLDVISQALSSNPSRGWRSIAFYSHVHVEAADKARAMGFQEVMPRSKFVQLLPVLFTTPLISLP